MTNQQSTKQVIVMRRDLGMSKGKIGAQAAHAAMSFITRKLDPCSPLFTYRPEPMKLPAITHWLNESFKKVVLWVESADELHEVYLAAMRRNMIVHRITDNGDSEFKGVPTTTCIAIGPDWDEAFVGLTDHLPSR